MFIFSNPPYIECPNCKEKAFGVCSIGPNGYTRRCGRCDFPIGTKFKNWFPLPKLNKKVIYLDQSALSNMMKALHPEAGHRGVPDIWKKLFCKLDRLSKLQVIVCPDSLIHFEESLVYEYGNEVKRVYELFSNGITFDDINFVWGRQILQSFESWIETGRPPERYNIERVISEELNAWQDRWIISSRLPTDSAFTKARKKEIHRRMLALYQVWKKEKKDFSHWFRQELDSIKEMAAEKFRKALVEVSQFQYELSAGEAEKKVAEYFSTDLSEHVPLARIQSALFAQTAHDASVGSKKGPKDEGDFNDIQAISLALPYCDAVLVDKASCNLVNSVSGKADLLFPGQIFGNNLLEDFLKILDTIESKISPEHMRAVEEVYGSNQGEPYVDVFREDRRSE